MTIFFHQPIIRKIFRDLSLSNACFLVNVGRVPISQRGGSSCVPEGPQAAAKSRAKPLHHGRVLPQHGGLYLGRICGILPSKQTTKEVRVVFSVYVSGYQTLRVSLHLPNLKKSADPRMIIRRCNYSSISIKNTNKGLLRSL
jgi:hypothetical protein